MRYSIEIEVSDEAIQESGLDAEAYIHQEMGWLQDSGFRLISLQRQDEQPRDIEAIAPEQAEEFSPNALTRDDFIGKDLYIDSTNYYNGQLFEAGKSVCNGASADLKEFRFQSNRDNGHMDLGALSTRMRERVFDTPDAVASFVKRRYQLIERNPQQGIPGSFYSLKDFPLFFVGRNQVTDRISIQHALAHEDRWTGQATTHVYGGPSGGMEFHAVPLGQSFSIRIGNHVNECVVVDNLEEAIKHCVAFMGETVRQFEHVQDEKPLSNLMAEAKERRQTNKNEPESTNTGKKK